MTVSFWLSAATKGSTYDLVADAAAPFSPTPTDDETPVVVRVKVHGVERVG